MDCETYETEILPDHGSTNIRFQSCPGELFYIPVIQALLSKADTKCHSTIHYTDHWKIWSWHSIIFFSYSHNTIDDIDWMFIHHAPITTIYIIWVQLLGNHIVDSWFVCHTYYQCKSNMLLWGGWNFHLWVCLFFQKENTIPGNNVPCLRSILSNKHFSTV